MITTRDRLAALVEGLYEKTLEGNLEWSLLAESGSVICRLGANKIRINEETDSLETNIRVTILNNANAEVDTFNDTLFNEIKPRRYHVPGYFSLMTNLIEAARRKATGADEVLDELLSSLGAVPVSEEDAQAAKRSAAFGGQLDDDVPF